MIDIKDYFTEVSRISHIPNEEYDRLDDLIAGIDAFSRTTYRGIYVIDYYRQNFLYVSDNPFFLYGFTVEEVKELGFKFYINHMHHNDFKLFKEMDIIVYQFLQRCPAEEIKNFTLSYDFYIKNKLSRQKHLVNHQITPLRMAECGKVWLALCVTTIPSNKKAGNITMYKSGIAGFCRVFQCCRFLTGQLRANTVA
jgi:PAS domain-containing protein